MFQRLLITVLLATTAFGPQWCCCRIRSALAETSLSLSGQTSVPRSSCCEHGGTRDHGRQAPSKEGCPCKNRTRDLTSAGSATAVVQDLLRTAEGVGCFFVVAESTPFGEIAESFFAPRSYAESGLTLSGRDRLLFKQTLRC